MGPGANADCGDADGEGDGLAERRRDTFNHDGERTGGLQCLGVGDKALGIGVLLALHLVAAELADALGSQADMAQDGDAILDERGNGVCTEGSALNLDAVRAGFLEETPGVGERLPGGDLVGHERHIGHDHGPGDPAGNGGGVVEHLLHGDGQGCGIAEHGVGQGIAHERHVDACGIEMACGGEVIGGQAHHLAVALESLDPFGRPFRLHREVLYRNRSEIQT